LAGLVRVDKSRAMQLVTRIGIRVEPQFGVRPRRCGAWRRRVLASFAHREQHRYEQIRECP
jgi:hypothetical protein